MSSRLIKILIALCLVCVGVGFAYLHVDRRVTRFELPQGELRWTNVRPRNVKMCIPAAFTNEKGEVTGAYRIDGVSHGSSKRMKVSLVGDSFILSREWQSDNGFMQLPLVYDSKPLKFRDSRRSVRRALCKEGGETFILESNYPMTMSSFAYYCSRHCDDAVYLDMGEYGYGYIKRYGFIRPLYIWALVCSYKQTNWLYIE